MSTGPTAASRGDSSARKSGSQVGARRPRAIALVVLALGVACTSTRARADDAEARPQAVNPRGDAAAATLPWGSPEGFERLARTRHKASFAALANHFEPQRNRLFCGPASATIVLNALRDAAIAKPRDPRSCDPADAAFLPPGFDPAFSRYTQDAFFTARTDDVKTRRQVFGEPAPGTTARDYGVQLHQLAGMLRAHGAGVTMRVVDDALPVANVRAELSAAMLDASAFAIVNYDRHRLGQPGGGHISPIGAYDPESDSFLVMDVNPNAGPWTWVRTEPLVAAMRTRDTSENRGYLIVREGLAPGLP